MKAVAFSHLQALPDSVTWSRSVVQVNGESLVDPEFVPDWDLEMDLELTLEVTIDLAGVRESAGLGPEAEVGALARWHASGSGLRGASHTFELLDGRTEVRLSLNGPDLGGVLEIDVLVILIRPGSSPDDLAAEHPGSLLWEDSRRIRLEGEGSRFPVSHVSFRDAGLAGGLTGAWALHFETRELQDSGVGNMRLYLNTDHPAVQRYLDDPESDELLGAVLRQDVSRQMLLQALHHEELDLSRSYPADSMGELLASAVRRAFPANTLEEVRSLARNAPGEFEAQLQARGRFLQ